MKSLISAAALAAILATSSASAFWNNDNGNGNGNGNGTGHGNGSAAGEGSFSMSFSGKGKGNMDAQTDMVADGDTQTYNGYAPYYGAPVAQVAPKAPAKK